MNADELAKGIMSKHIEKKSKGLRTKMTSRVPTMALQEAARQLAQDRGNAPNATESLNSYDYSPKRVKKLL